MASNVRLKNRTLEAYCCLRGLPEACLARNPNIALYREVIYEQVWEKEYTGDSRTIDLHVQRLKKKLGWDKHICAVYKIGYRLET